MTDLLSRPAVRVEAPAETPRKPVALTAALAAIGSVATGVLITIALAVAAWFAADSGSFSGSIRVGALAWLVSIGGGLHLAGATVTAIPLGSALLVGWMLYRSGYWAAAASAVRTLREVALAATVMALICCLSAAIIWSLTRSGNVHADLLRTLLASAVLGGGTGGFGALRGARLSGELLDLMPEELRSAVTGGAAGLLTLLAAASALLTAAVVVHFSRAVTLAEGLHTGLVGGFILALVGVALVPNGVLAAAAYLAGPGFAVGAGTSVSADGVTMGPLPAFPLLAALPTQSGRWWQTGLVVVPIVAGGIAGWIAMRRYPVEGLDKAALRGGLAGLAGGLTAGAASWAATGAVGPGRMAHVGPDVAAMVVVCAVAFAVGGVATAAGAQWAAEGGSLFRRHRSSAEHEPPESRPTSAEHSDPLVEQYGVSDSTDETPGVSDSTDETSGVSDSTDETSGVSDSTDDTERAALPSGDDSARSRSTGQSDSTAQSD